MTFYTLNLGTFFRPSEAVFTKYRGQDLAGSAKRVPRWTSRLRQVVEFTLTNHVHFSLTCGEAGWGRAYNKPSPTTNDTFRDFEIKMLPANCYKSRFQ